MNQSEIKHVQSRIGVEADGFWGPVSTEAAKRHLRKLMPFGSPFPKQSGVTGFYGPHGDPGVGYSPPTKKITLPFSVYYGTSAIKTLSPHEKCADSLLYVFEKLAKEFPTEEARRAAGILTYDGLYNPRKMRGVSSWSMHSWAIAIDLDAGRNGNRTHWASRAKMPIEVMECFAKGGWLSAGAFWSRDAMHFQATKES